VEDEPVRVALYGIVGWLLVAPVMLILVVLCVTWILIPFALIGLAGLLAIGYVGFCLYAGKRTARLFRWRIASPALQCGLGVLVLWVLGLVGLLPNFGAALSGLLAGAVMVMSLGAALMTRFGTDPSGTWLHRRGSANGRWPYAPGPTPVAAPASPPPATDPTEDLDLDEKTLEVLRDLPDEPEDMAPSPPGASGPPPAS
jgi:hypothetical protein